MKSFIRWTIRNTPAMNTLMVGILVAGLFSMLAIRRELFPEFDLDYITISVPYPGASPDEVEEGICQKVEEAVRATDGIKKIHSTAREGVGIVTLELFSNIPNVQKVLNEVRSDVDQIISFPQLAEDPEIEQITLRRPAIRVGVVGPPVNDSANQTVEKELRLREIAETVRTAILQKTPASQVDFVGARDYQVDIEIPERTLRRYGLTLKQVANQVRRENIELPGGNMRSDSQEVLMRGKNKRLVGTEIAKIPIITRQEGVVLTLDDLGIVSDAFSDETSINEINGQPAVVISVQKTSTEDLLEIVDSVHKLLAEVNTPDGIQLPEGYELVTWQDMAVMVRDRINLLARNGFQGLILVVVVLGIFLERRLAFWVALGLPFAILGAFGIMHATGQTLNMMSLFAFLTALGILVDDAIVVGENVYTHRQLGKKPLEATIDGTVEVLPSVTTSVTTTIIAFLPLLFVPGVMGKFIGALPKAVIAMLLLSLIEVIFILPCHLVHSVGHAAETRPTFWSGMVRLFSRPRFLLIWSTTTMLLWGFVTWKLVQNDATRESAMLQSGLLLVPALFPAVISWSRISERSLFGLIFKALDQINFLSDRGLQWFIKKIYLPILRSSLNRPAVTLATAVTVLLLAIGLYVGGIIKFTYFPKIDGNIIKASIAYPDGTPASITDRATRQLEEAIWAVNEKYLKEKGSPLMLLSHRSVGQPSSDSPVQGAAGSHLGIVDVELVETSLRDKSSIDIISEWRKKSNEFPGVESVIFEVRSGGPGGKAIEFRLLSTADHMAELEEAVEVCKAKMTEYPGVFDIIDNSQPGKWEYQIRVKEEAKALGSTASDLAETVRGSYYGEEVMRLQRGRHEVKLMVRYPENERRSLDAFDDIRVRIAPSVDQIIKTAMGQSDRSASRPTERPLSELADVKVARGYSQITRLDQLRSITIGCDVDNRISNAREIVAGMKENFFPGLLKEYPDIQLRWEGQQADSAESLEGLIIGLLLALVGMFALLTLEFRSYLQPVIIMAIIPFGCIGAIIGHIFLRIDLTIISIFGLVALTGVVVNDSIVLIDFINHRVRSGIPIREALLDAGRRRFRPVMLTSLTTVVGLLPILTERSMQAQFIIPMATSLCFGLAFSTFLILLLVPTLYLVYAKFTRVEEYLEIETADTLEQTHDY
jgi:hydrophobic/amphiphilic exporter-1 (mainly G- bacteria), HAE1 family